MSLQLIASEISRFLGNKDPEIICIRGEWGIGKTYAWRKYLSEAHNNGQIKLDAYSYVSLFGLNSLDDLKFSIFENTVHSEHFISGPSLDTLNDLFSKKKTIGRRIRPVLDGALALLNRKSVADVIYRTSFLSVRNQLICLDDMERAGNSLTSRDILGLSSFLKDDRKCKIVILLNHDKLDKSNKSDFDAQIEKLADTYIKFDISSEDAAKIALGDDNDIIKTIKTRISELKIKNIRTIKRVEKQIRRILEILPDVSSETVDQVITTAVLAGWSVYHPDEAPPLDYIKKYNRFSIAMNTRREQPSSAIEPWRNSLDIYPYRMADDLDTVIINGIENGYFDEDALNSAASKIEEQRLATSRDNEFIKAWEVLYHGSLSSDDDEFLDTLFPGAIDNARSITPLNINGAIKMLKECGRKDQARQVIDTYIKSHSEEGRSFFRLGNHHFSSDDIVDDDLMQAFQEKYESIVDSRSPLDVLRNIADRHGWSEDDMALMAKQSVSDLETYFETLEGAEMRRAIDMLLIMGRSGRDLSSLVLATTTEALRRIAAKSPLRARKVAAFGIALEEPRDGSIAGSPPAR